MRFSGGAGVDFHAVAGREAGFFNAFQCPQLFQHDRDGGFAKGIALAYLDGRGLMADAEGDDFHVVVHPGHEIGAPEGEEYEREGANDATEAAADEMKAIVPDDQRAVGQPDKDGPDHLGIGPERDIFRLADRDRNDGQSDRQQGEPGQEQTLFDLLDSFDRGKLGEDRLDLVEFQIVFLRDIHHGGGRLRGRTRHRKAGSMSHAARSIRL